MLLITLHALFSVLFTALFFFPLFEGVRLLWLLPIFLGFFVAFQLLHVLFLVLSSFCFSKKPPERYSPFARAVLVISVDWILCLLRARVRVLGKELLPKEPFILISNHRSAMDALVALHAFPGRKLCFISKASVLRWRVVGPYMLQSGSLGIERDMPLKALRVIQSAAKKVKNGGLSFGIFPEGTRTKDGRVGEFKEGAFIAAKRAECPIVLVTTEGTEHIFRRFSPKITVTVRAVIDADTVKKQPHTELSSICRSTICKALGEES